MSVWAKLIGGVAGMAVAGPFGAVIGAALGHAAENSGLGRIGSLAGGMLQNGLLEGLWGGGDAAPTPGPGATPGLGAARTAAMFGRRDEVFALCVVVLAAKLAKCDGPVSAAEIAEFKRTFRVPPHAAGDIGRLFDEARIDPAGFEPYATQLGRTFADAPGLLEDALTGLFQIARADGPVDEAERHFLQVVWVHLRLDSAAWDRASGRAARASGPGQAGGAGRTGGSQRPTRPPPEDVYAVLGMPRSASDEALRVRWRTLARQNHPDALAGSGAPAARVAEATAALARINAAWDSIKRERGL